MAPIGVSPRPLSTLNQPSAFTSKTRSNSRGSLSFRKWLISRPAPWRSTSTRELRCLTVAQAFATAAPSRRSHAYQKARPPARSTASRARKRRRRPLEGHQLLLDHRRGGPLAPGLQALEDVALETVLVGVEAGEVGIRAIGLGDEIEEVERPSGSGGQVGGDGGDDGARGSRHHEDALSTERHSRTSVGRRALREADGEAQAVLVAHLDDARVALGLLDEQVGELGRLARGLEVDRLDESVRLLALPGLGEPRDRATERGDGPRLVVAVLAAEARGGDEERARSGHPPVEGAHRRVEQLDSHAEGLAPVLEAQGGEVAPRASRAGSQ